jgi:CubicO group peptidase (beta-lactamase class C family)
MRTLQLVARWEVANAAAAVVAADGRVVGTIGDVDREYRLASLTKIATGWTAMVAVEEGTIALDDPVGQPGCTLRHLLAHAGGYPTNGAEPITRPGRRRIYSNTGIELGAAAIEQRAGMPFAAYLGDAVLAPLHMTHTRLDGSPASGMCSTVSDLIGLLGELQRSRLLSSAGAVEAVTIQFAELSGIVPGVGRFDPCPWGLGIEIRGEKWPHWTGERNSPATFGHFGAAGSMLWVDPDARCGLVALTDRAFDDWPGALAAWSELSDAVVAEWVGASA